MKIIVPILLIAAVGFFACNRTTPAEPAQTEVAPPSKNPMSKSSNAMSVSSGKKVSIPLVPHNPVPQPELTPEIIAKHNATDELVKFAETERNKSLDRTDLVVQLLSDQDHLFYTKKDGEFVEALLSSKMENESLRHYYYFNGEGFAFYRRLEWQPMADKPFARETIVFFEDGEIFDIQIREAALEQGQGPNKLFGEKFNRPPVDKVAYKEEISYMWGVMLGEIEKNKENEN